MMRCVVARLCQCVRCSTAYHASYTCLAAGSQLLSASAMICSRHVTSSKVHSRISTTWCIACDKGLTLGFLLPANCVLNHLCVTEGLYSCFIEFMCVRYFFNAVTYLIAINYVNALIQQFQTYITLRRVHMCRWCSSTAAL